MAQAYDERLWVPGDSAGPNYDAHRAGALARMRAALGVLRDPSPELVEAVARGIWGVFRIWGPPIRQEKPEWERLGEDNQRIGRDMARAALAAAVDFLVGEGT